jgi:hypothetical protein
MSTQAPATQATATATRRTRRPDRFTDLFLVLSAFFGLWGVVLIVLTALAIVQPAFFYSDAKAAIKAAGASVIAVLALSQVYTMESTMGHLPRRGLKMKHLMRTHRWGGRIALVLAAVIAYFCMTDLGAPLNPIRAALHGFFGSTAFAAIGIKLGLIRFRPLIAYDVAPWLGRYAAVAFIVVWITSAYAFYTGQL